MKNLFKVLPLVSVLFLQSCATIISGSRQTIQFNSNPANATVFINEIEAGKTPFQKRLKRNEEYKVSIELEGYETYETKLTKKFNEWYIGNIIFGGLVGLVVDPITGAIYKLSPKEVNSRMTEDNSDIVFKDNGQDIHISVSLNIDPEWEQVGQLTKAE